MDIIARGMVSTKTAMTQRRSNRFEPLALLFASTFPTVAAWFYFVVLADHPALPLLYTVCKTIQFSFPVAWVLAVQGRPFWFRRENRSNLFPGFLSGAIIAVLLLVVYFVFLKETALIARATPRIVEKIEAIGALTPLRFLTLALFLSVIHSFLEEYYWRWFVFGRLRHKMGLVTALVISSLAFMAHHVIILNAFFGPENFWTATAPFSLAVATGGVLWAWLYEKWGSLPSPWVSHMLVDLGIMAIGYDLSWGLF